MHVCCNREMLNSNEDVVLDAIKTKTVWTHFLFQTTENIINLPILCPMRRYYNGPPGQSTDQYCKLKEQTLRET